MGAVAGLRGKVLLCHCSPQEPCHGDVLIEAALAAGGDEEADLSTSGEDSDGKWAIRVGAGGDAASWVQNYSTTFREQSAEGMMVSMPYSKAKEAYGDQLRVAALGAIKQGDGGFRIIHDGTHGVLVNGAIRVRDQEGCPFASRWTRTFAVVPVPSSPWPSTFRRPTAVFRSPVWIAVFNPARFSPVASAQPLTTRSGSTSSAPTGLEMPPIDGGASMRCCTAWASSWPGKVVFVGFPLRRRLPGVDARV